MSCQSYTIGTIFQVRANSRIINHTSGIIFMIFSTQPPFIFIIKADLIEWKHDMFSLQLESRRKLLYM